MDKGTVTEKSWHNFPIDQVLEQLEVDSQSGLSSEEVIKRRNAFGPNVLTPKKGQPAWLRFILQFHQALVYILLVAAIVTFLLHEFVDSSVIFGVILVNAIIGFAQETKALNAINALARSLKTRSTVLRDGVQQNIPAEELVPGDIVLLSSGDKVPADMRLIEVKSLQVNESALTGESVPVKKDGNVVGQNITLADRINMVYASTLVTYGQGKGMVVGTGDQTEIGRISQLISAAEDLATPLTKKIARFSRLLLYIILAMAALTFVVGVMHGQSLVEMFMAAIALAVGAIPEGLPAAVTIILAIGVSRMAKRRAIIRKLPTVETLGSTTVICSDKTGTLTENQMTVQEIFCDGRIFEVTGAGYTPKGQILADKNPIDPLLVEPLKECLVSGLCCNTAQLVEKDGRYEIEGDPTEGALIVSAQKAGLTNKATNTAYKRLDVIPFESEYQYMATLHSNAERNGLNIVFMKGAMERIIDRCSNVANKETVLAQAESMAAKGLRVLAFAKKDVPAQKKTLDHDDLQELTFLGLQGMIDPPRKEAIRAVKTCYEAGVRVKMITGDHVITATSIANQLGLKHGRGTNSEKLLALSGKDLEQLNPQEFARAADEGSVFARVTPEQKLLLVKALQEKGDVVAMTGDGVNDAPALKQANIGISMGITGTEVAKEAADMILTDDNFASIEAAVEEGRCVFDNLKKFIVWTLPTNLGEGLTILLAVLVGTLLPILPVQILWINMSTAIFLGLMLAFEPREPDLMRRAPQDPALPIMTRDVLIRTLYVGFILVGIVFGLFKYFLLQGAPIGMARTVATTALVMGELVYLFNCRSLKRSIFSVGLFSNGWIWVGCGLMLLSQILFVHAPFMNKMFHSVPISLQAWILIFVTCLVIPAVVAVEKLVRSRLASK